MKIKALPEQSPNYIAEKSQDQPPENLSTPPPKNCLTPPPPENISQLCGGAPSVITPKANYRYFL